MTIQKIQEIMSKARGTHECYRRLFSTPDGKVVLAHLVKQANVLGSTFVAGDPYKTSHNEGQRHIVLSILRYINRDPEKMLQQLQEQLEND